MKKMNSSVACAGMDVHYKFSNVTFRDASGRIVSRQRLDHPDREQLQKRLSSWPRGIPVVMEASFGWGWLSDLVEDALVKRQWDTRKNTHIYLRNQHLRFWSCIWHFPPQNAIILTFN